MKKIFTGTLLLAFSSLISKLLGVIRTNRFADVFGADIASDAYFAAFQIPDFMYNMVILGAISAAFIPMLSEYVTKEKMQDAWAYTSNFLNFILAIAFILSCVTYIFAPEIIRFLYFGFSPETQQLTIELTRIMLIAPIFFGISGIFGGIQNVYESFFWYSLAPIVYNASIIVGIIFFAPEYGIQGVAYGVVIGAFLHMAIQIPAMYHHGFVWKPIFALGRSDLKETLFLSFPRIFSLAIHQIGLIAEGIIAATLTFGSLTMLRYAQDIQYFPIGIIGFSFAISSFGAMSKLTAQKEYEKLSKLIKTSIDSVLFLVIPASFGLFVLKNEITQALLQFGAFDATATATTASVLGWLCLNLFALSIIPIITRIFYAFKNTLIPFIAGSGALTLGIALGIILSQNHGVIGLAQANVIATLLQLILLFFWVQHKYPIDHIVSYSKFFCMIAASLCMAFCVHLISPALSSVSVWIQVAALAAIGGVIYFIFTWPLTENKRIRQKIFFRK